MTLFLLDVRPRWRGQRLNNKTKRPKSHELTWLRRPDRLVPEGTIDLVPLRRETKLERSKACQDKKKIVKSHELTWPRGAHYLVPEGKTRQDKSRELTWPRGAHHFVPEGTIDLVPLGRETKR